MDVTLDETCTRHDPLDPGPLLASLRGHAVPGVETVEGATVRRLVRVGGDVRTVTATLGPDTVTLHGAPADALHALAGRWFGLDDDLAAVAGTLVDDPVLGALVRARPHLRILGHLDGFEAAVTTVLGQQVTLAAARTFAGRLVAAYGRPGPDGLVLFPEPAALVAADTEELRAAVRITGARARTLQALAAAALDGLDLAPGVDLARARAALLALPGIGPWTVEYLALRVLADRDAWPAGDVVLRRALGAQTTADVARSAEPWRPLRAYAAQHLWTAHAFVL